MEWAIVLPLVAFVAAGRAVRARSCGEPAGSSPRPATSSGSAARSRTSPRAVETSLAEICARIDAVRRGQIEAPAVVDDITASLDAVDKLRRGGSRPPSADRRRPDPRRDRRRARAGGAGARDDRARRVDPGVGPGGGREIEAQTAIKRGYLNVLHAREAIARHASEAATLVPADPSRRAVEPLGLNPPGPRAARQAQRRLRCVGCHDFDPEGGPLHSS